MKTMKQNMILWISGLFLLIVGTACEKESSKEESKETSDIVSQTKHDLLLLKNASPVEAFTYSNISPLSFRTP